MLDEAAVIDSGAAISSDSVSTSTETPVVSAETPVSSAQTPVSDVSTDPNDPMAALQAAMDAQLGKDEPVDPNAPPVAAEPGAIPAEFAQALQISSFVNTPESLQQAVRAADEVWQVASGQIPARQMIEGIRAANPQAYQAIVNDLKDYLGVQPAQNGALEALKAADPANYQKIAQFVQQMTGKALDGAVDPNHARLDAIEQRFAQEQEARQAEQRNQQINAARGKALEFLTAKTKGTFAEGQETYILQQAGAKTGIPQEQMVEMLLQGKTDKLEAAFKAVQKEETARLRAYNANLVKQHNALKNALPASKGAPVSAAKPNAKDITQRPGESDNEWRVRLWNSKLI